MSQPDSTTAAPLSKTQRDLIDRAGYDLADPQQRELGQMALHCAGMFFQTGTVTGTAPGRNSPCPCGSGKKYKRCCRDADEAAANQPRRQLALDHIPQLFDDDLMDADQDRLYALLQDDPALRHLRYDRDQIDTYLQAGIPDDDTELDAEGWTDLITDLAQKFHVEQAKNLDAIGALLACGRAGERDDATLRALANGVLHLSMAEMSGQAELNLVAPEILRATAADAEAAGEPLAAFAGIDDDEDDPKHDSGHDPEHNNTAAGDDA